MLDRPQPDHFHITSTPADRALADDALTALGRRTARALLNPDGHRGRGRLRWSDTLQLAADQSGLHPEILRIADEIHMAAADIRSDAGIRVYAVSTLRTTTSGVAFSFLVGMFEAASTRPGP